MLDLDLETTDNLCITKYVSTTYKQENALLSLTSLLRTRIRLYFISNENTVHLTCENVETFRDERSCNCNIVDRQNKSNVNVNVNADDVRDDLCRYSRSSSNLCVKYFGMRKLNV